MKKIRFSYTVVPPAAPTSFAIEERLSSFLAAWRTRGAPEAPDDASEDADSSLEWLLDKSPGKNGEPLSKGDLAIIKRRAKAYVAKVSAVRAPFAQAKEHLARIEGIRDLPVVGLADEHRCDEIAAALHASIPWFRGATTALWYAMKRSIRRAEPGLHVPPILLVGPGGIGKSWFASEVARLVGVPLVKIDATGEPTAWPVVGLQRGWTGGEPGRVLTAILEHRIANPIVFIDEIEKAGRPESSKGITYSLPDALLPLLERATARRWTCPFFRMDFDMSHVGWLLAANSLEGLSEPFLSRVRVVEVEEPDVDDIVGFCIREGAQRGLDTDSIGALVSTILQRPPGARRLNLRDVLRAMDLMEVLEMRPLLH